MHTKKRELRQWIRKNNNFQKNKKRLKAEKRKLHA